MSKVIFDNPELGPQETYSTAGNSAGSLLTYVENNTGFTSGKIVLFGIYGQEKAEAVALTGVTGHSVINHSAGTVYAHPARTPIVELMYDQVEISRSTSEGGTYTVLTTVALSVDEMKTTYIDTGGTTAHWYKGRFLNSVSGSYSDYTDEMQGTGYTDDSLGSMTEEVLAHFGDPDAQEVTKETVRNVLNGGTRKLVMQIIRMFPDYFGAYTTQSLSSTNSYSYPSNFISFKRINIGAAEGDSYNAEFKKESELDPTWTYYETDPKIVMRNSTWKTYPSCSGKTAYIYFWQYPSVMSNDTDEHGLPYGGRDVLVTYALYRIWLNKDVDRAKVIKSLFDEQVKEYLEFVGQSRQASNNYFQGVSFGSEDYEV